LKINDKYNQAILYNELAFAYKNLISENPDNFSKSAQNYQKSEDIYREMGLNSLALLMKENRITLYAHNSNDNTYVIALYKEVIMEVKEKHINHNLLWV